MSDSEPALHAVRSSSPSFVHIFILFPYQLLDQILSGHHVVHTLAGTTADIHHISGNVDFGGFPSIRSGFEEVNCLYPAIH